ncbi:MAG: AMP-binding protein [Pseudomonadales bacterium]|jgi:long-chain acyl-CoA synthetase|nr:AMP-binding protein [Pseudomonadales bacterium]MDP6469717.1 AMP-binding protein [Pseudomonadales bacterium]MDP6827682.1 AMP-binding protein [Pseudomonadales bacterium]MDP6971878.1 AMP-binding protein [Pseudomonadales bacterium]
MLDTAETGSPEFWATENPKAVAVIKDDRSLTYREWNDQANRVADALSALGLTPGDRIGMRFRLDLPWFIVQRALQKLGVVLVAVNWKLTPEEAMYIIRDSNAKGLACDDVDAALWAEQSPGLLITVGQAPGCPGHRLEDLLTNGKPTERFGPARINMVLYTSGTTGNPKGVPPADPATLDLERLLRYGASVGSVPPHPDTSTVLLSLPVHHGAGPAIASGAYSRGGTVVLLDPYDPEAALRLIERHSIQLWTAVPTMLLRIQALPEDVFARYDLSSLTAINAGAAPVPQSLKAWLVDRLGPGMLWEAYGCSEAGMITYIAPEHQLTKPGSSGLPYEGVEIAIVDEDWNRLPPGSTGEIAVNTPVVLAHYLGREPLGEDTVKDGFYRTGDVGHLDEDGYLFITDRLQDMIVAGGVNIYPTEIEKAIVAHPDVENCAVIGIPQDDFGEQVLAFVVPRPGNTLSRDDLLTHLDGHLASFKKPRQFEFVDQLPLNPSGKVLKNELRTPYWQGRDRNV